MSPRNGTTSVRGRKLVIWGLVFAAVVFSGKAGAITDTIFKYSTTKTGYFSISAVAFSPNISTNQYYFQNQVDLRPSTNDLMCFAAPIFLPHGARMTEVRFWHANYNGSQTFRIMRRGVGRWFDVISTGSFPQTTFTSYFEYAKSIPSVVVNNRDYSYHLEYCVQNGLNAWIAKARIKYTYNTAGD